MILGAFAILLVAMFGFLTGNFSKKAKALKETEEELEEARNILEIRVRARTKELETVASSLESKVQARTRELSESREALLNVLGDAEGAKVDAEQERDKTLAIIENFPEGLLFFDSMNNLSSINPRARSFFGLDDSAIANKDIGNLKNILSFAPLMKILGEDLKLIEHKELKLAEDLILEVSTIPVIRAGERAGTLCVLRNVTREKMIEQLKTEFVSITAHQLRTPLSAIKWTLRMLLDGDVGILAKEQAGLLEQTYKSNERMIRLINDLLNVTRIEEGRFLYHLKREDVVEIAEKVIDHLGESAKRKGLKIELKKPAVSIPAIEVDSEKIFLALQNLVDNAIHYTKQGGVVISIDLNKEKGKVLFSIKDTGIGIPKKQQKRVFSRFFRASNAIKTETEGTGLGLFIAQNIIKAHGGRIWFESGEGKGSSFYFTLPIK